MQRTPFLPEGLPLADAASLLADAVAAMNSRGDIDHGDRIINAAGLTILITIAMILTPKMPLTVPLLISIVTTAINPTGRQ